VVHPAINQIDSTKLADAIRKALEARKLAYARVVLFVPIFLFMFVTVAFSTRGSISIVPILIISFVGALIFSFVMKDGLRMAVWVYESMALAGGPGGDASWTVKTVAGSSLPDIEGYHLPARELLDAADTIRLSARSTPVRYATSNNLRSDLFLTLAAVCIVCGAGLLFGSLLLVPRSIKQLTIFGIGFASLITAPLAFHRFRRHRQPSAEQLLGSDTRAPVLWLRSFADDDLVLRDWDPGLQGTSDRTLEDVLTSDMWTYGPVVAVGAPGEKLPRLGASRGYFDDTKWHEAVAHWMAQACVIVLVIGKSKWIVWELENAIKHRYLSKLILVFPPKSGADNAERWANVLSAFREMSCYEAMTQIDLRFSRVGHFREDGSFVIIDDLSDDGVTYDVALRIAIYGLFGKGEISGGKFPVSDPVST
jgi:hypothetical protein